MKPIRLTVLAAVALVAPLAFAQGAKLKVGLMLPATGEAVAKRGHKKIVTVTWKYAAGDEMVVGFKEAFDKAGGQVVKELNLPAALRARHWLTRAAAVNSRLRHIQQGG